MMVNGIDNTGKKCFYMRGFLLIAANAFMDGKE